MMKTCPVDGPVKLLPMAASFSLVSEASCLMYNNLFLKKVKGSVLRGTGVGKGVCVCLNFVYSKRWCQKLGTIRQ